jgi:cobalamin biosynthesis protein CobD/CbiB
MKRIVLLLIDVALIILSVKFDWHPTITVGFLWTFITIISFMVLKSKWKFSLGVLVIDLFVIIALSINLGIKSPLSWLLLMVGYFYPAFFTYGLVVDIQKVFGDSNEDREDREQVPGTEDL